ncbi:FtsX-like permease family protein [Demequina subtropica]|uniref:FtsX-like permease family protein n=1 Tax=Demequina subtropica TaxID=1638989 RepID=UPI000B2207F9|nr:FtsX-like permease family protein [Demequina subtropica]
MRGIFGGLNGALVREQWRAQRRYTLTAGVMVALATGLATFAVASVMTQAAVASDANTAYAGAADAENIATLPGWGNGVGYLHGEQLYDRSATSEEIDAIVADAAAQGIDVSVSQGSYAIVAESGDRGMYLAAVDPESAAPLMYEGEAPGPGEVALASLYARDLALGIGDTITLVGRDLEGIPDADPVTLTVSGFAKTLAFDAVDYDVTSLISPDSLADVAAVGGILPAVNERGERTGSYDIVLAWDGPMVAGLEDVTTTWERSDTSPWLSSSLGAGEMLSLMGAGLLAIVAVGAAIAAGRSQGEARTQWVATARALGATRRDIVVAGALEGLVVGVIAGAIGVAAGWGVEAWIYSAQPASRPDVYGPALAVLPLGYVAALLGLAIILALVIGLVPALWASRVEPSAALSPRGATHQRDAEPRSRRVPLAWLGGIGALGLAVAAGNPPSTTGGIDAIAVGAWIAVAVVAAAFGVVAVRALLPHASAALARTGRPALVLASHALGHRTGSLTAAATGLLLSAGLTFGAVETTVMAPVRAYDDDLMAAGATLATWDLVVDALLVWWLGGALLLMAGGFMVGLAEWMGRGAALREAATAGALGLDRHGRQIAAIARVAVPMSLGVIVGVALGLLGVAVFEVWEQLGAGASTILARDLPVVILRALIAALGIVAGGAAGVGIASLFAARGVDARSPQEAQRLAR